MNKTPTEKESMLHLSTPTIVVNEEILRRNIRKMAQACREKKIALRPHFKAHKLLPIAKMQKEEGARGFTVAKLSEAAVLIKAGYQDVLVAYPLWGHDKWKEYEELASQAKMATIIDSFESLVAWEERARKKRRPVEVYIKVDTGLHRVGYAPGEKLYDLIQRASKNEHIILRGLLTHAGHVYGAKNEEERKRIALEEGKILLTVAHKMRKEGIALQEISVGATPTVAYNLQTPGVTEVRPGNYVFNDATQVRLSVAKKEDCALRVLTTVVARPAENRRIIDGGAKVFALDKGAHGQDGTDSYGIVENIEGWKLCRLSEEHGVLEKIRAEAPELPLGSRITVIPNHACPVVNLTNAITVLDQQNQVIEHWPVDARGCSQ
ncbi:alanine racemase [Heliorestis convoluta]|uniref:alanine racemase n=1 Tax=Heliorestis convoluta TaxID=356322 RepID=UPI00138A0B98|nr:alanine racemase [Heliorestis convoluta]